MGIRGLERIWLRVCERSSSEVADSGGSEPRVAPRGSGRGDEVERSVIVLC
jgi:hypothetical protein